MYIEERVEKLERFVERFFELFNKKMFITQQYFTCQKCNQSFLFGADFSKVMKRLEYFEDLDFCNACLDETAKLFNDRTVLTP